MDRQDRLDRAYARLRAIRDNTTDRLQYVDERFVEEYHQALDHLAQLGYDTDEFKIPPNDVQPRIVGWAPKRVGSRDPDIPRLSNDRSVSRDLFLTKVDSALNYFAFATDPAGAKKEPIGFTGPKRP
jgi:hypothetical protein